MDGLKVFPQWPVLTLQQAVHGRVCDVKVRVHSACQLSQHSHTGTATQCREAVALTFSVGVIR